MKSPPCCVSCGCQLSITQSARQNHCGQVACQQASVKLFLDKQSKKEEELRNQVAHLCADDAHSSENIPVILLPSNKSDLSTLSKQRKSNFIKHLASVFDSLSEGNLNSSFPYSNTMKSLDDNVQDTNSAALNQACGVCQGHCCRLGGDHAFQDSTSLSEFMASTNNALSKEEVLARYQQFLPVTSYKEGCVFQGEMGCTLPRNMRGLTCNKYACEPLIQLANTLKQSGVTKTHVGAIRDGKVKRHQVLFNVKQT